jgi:hypothetical protein
MYSNSIKLRSKSLSVRIRSLIVTQPLRDSDIAAENQPTPLLRVRVEMRDETTEN